MLISQLGSINELCAATERVGSTTCTPFFFTTKVLNLCDVQQRQHESDGKEAELILYTQVDSVKDIMEAKKLLFPGVGSYGQAMVALKSRGFVEPLREYLLVSCCSHVPINYHDLMLRSAYHICCQAQPFSAERSDYSHFFFCFHCNLQGIFRPFETVAK
jgi:hypothetical protein